jgi:hypothetical protein
VTDETSPTGRAAKEAALAWYQQFLKDAQKEVAEQRLRESMSERERHRMLDAGYEP